MREAKKMATLIALGSIAAATWYKNKVFVNYKDLEESFTKYLMY